MDQPGRRPPFRAGERRGLLTFQSILHAIRSPIGIGIGLGYVVGKRTAMLLGSWLVTRLSRGSLHPQVGFGAVVGSGITAGIGLTVSLLVADLAFTGVDLRTPRSPCCSPP